MWVIFAILLQDPDSESGYGSTDQIESGSETLLNIFSNLLFFQSGANRAQEKVVFIAESSGEAGSVVEVEGDPGQGRQEDRDLYTTRTA